jgi:phosphohistidine phosphatase
LRHVFLVRHAKSSWAEHGLDDHARPLADRGIADTARMFARLRESGIAPATIVSSDAERALKTAARLRQSLGLDTSNLQLDPDLYHASAERILEIVRRNDDAVASTAFVGHNPGLTDAANRLADDLTLDNLPTCGIAGIAFDAGRWRDIDFGAGRLVYFDYPKNSGPPLRRPTREIARDRE